MKMNGFSSTAMLVALTTGLAAQAPAQAPAQPPQQAQEPPRPTVKPRWMMVGVNVTDLGRSTKFYKEVLGLVVKREYHPTDRPMAQVNLGFPGDSPLAPEVTLVWREGHKYTGRVTSGRLEFELPDIQAAVDKAVALGGKVDRPVAPINGFAGLLNAQIIDPDGHDIELVQRLP